MYMYLQYALYYFAFVSIRHTGVCIAVACARRPQKVMDMSNLINIGMDVFLVVLLTVFGTQVLFGEDAKQCSYQSESLMKWWILSTCCLIYGWVYSALLCIGLAGLPLILVFWCFYKM